MGIKTVLAGLVVGLPWLAFQVIGQGPPRGPEQDFGPVPPPGRPAPGDGDGPPPPFPPPFPPPPEPVLRVLDADADGELSAAEIGQAAEALRKLDRDHDGKLTESELRPPRRGGPPPPPGGPGPGQAPDARAFATSLLRFDKDGDGLVTTKEVPERLRPMVEQCDTNHDGGLDRAEIEAMARRAPRRGGPGRPPGPPPRGPQGEER